MISSKNKISEKNEFRWSVPMTFVEGSPTSRDSLLSPGHGNRRKC